MPTFAMDDFFFHSAVVRWIKSSIAADYTYYHACMTADCLSAQDGQSCSFHMVTQPYTHTHPEYPYTHTTSAYSAQMQAYIRSGQLPTNAYLASRGSSATNRCRFGCSLVEDKHHMFVVCKKHDIFWHKVGTGLRE